MYDFDSNSGPAAGGSYLDARAVDGLVDRIAPGPNEHMGLWLALSLDHVGRGMLVVRRGGVVLHANRLASASLACSGHHLLVSHGRLSARSPGDNQALATAIEAALQRGVRRMLTLGRTATAQRQSRGNADDGTMTVAVLPLQAPATGLPADCADGSAVLISMPLSNRVKNLAIPIFAREQGCTSAETAVLEALLEGQTPEAIALQRDVRLCTVRTQIGQLRLKTGCRTIRELLDLVASLPPRMVLVQ